MQRVFQQILNNFNNILNLFSFPYKFVIQIIYIILNYTCPCEFIRLPKICELLSNLSLSFNSLSIAINHSRLSEK